MFSSLRFSAEGPVNHYARLPALFSVQRDLVTFVNASVPMRSRWQLHDGDRLPRAAVCNIAFKNRATIWTREGNGSLTVHRPPVLPCLPLEYRVFRGSNLLAGGIS